MHESVRLTRQVYSIIGPMRLEKAPPGSKPKRFGPEVEWNEQKRRWTLPEWQGGIDKPSAKDVPGKKPGAAKPEVKKPGAAKPEDPVNENVFTSKRGDSTVNSAGQKIVVNPSSSPVLFISPVSGAIAQGFVVGVNDSGKQVDVNNVRTGNRHVVDADDVDVRNSTGEGLLSLNARRTARRKKDARESEEIRKPVTKPEETRKPKSNAVKPEDTAESRAASDSKDPGSGRSRRDITVSLRSKIKQGSLLNSPLMSRVGNQVRRTFNAIKAPSYMSVNKNKWILQL